MPQISDVGTPPALDQANLQLQRGQVRSSRALERALLLRRFRDRTVPGIIDTQAGRGAFFTGATSRKVKEAGQDLVDQYAGGEVATQINLADLMRNQFLIGLGLQL